MNLSASKFLDGLADLHSQRAIIALDKSLFLFLTGRLRIYGYRSSILRSLWFHGRGSRNSNSLSASRLSAVERIDKESSRSWTVDDHRVALTMPRNVSEELLSIGGPESVANSGRRSASFTPFVDRYKPSIPAESCYSFKSPRSVQRGNLPPAT